MSLLVIALFMWRRRRGIRAAATNFLANATTLDSGAHSYRQVSLAAFPHLDAAFYDAAKQALESDGFSWLADVEDMTVTAAGGAMMPAAARVMAGDDGAIIAAIHHARTRATTGAGAASYRIADFETPFDDGTFMITSNAALAGALSSPPEVHAEFHDAATSVPTLLARHRARLREHASTHTGVAPLSTSTVNEALAHQERLDAIKSAFRSARPGMFSAEELRRLAPRGTESVAAKVATQLVELDQRRSA